MSYIIGKSLRLIEDGCIMKLKDCGCGCMAQVTYEINGHNDFVIGCTVCDNRTPACESLIEAVSMWNQIYCYALPLYATEPA
jgi:hypothetical protein